MLSPHLNLTHLVSRSWVQWHPIALMKYQPLLPRWRRRSLSRSSPYPWSFFRVMWSVGSLKEREKQQTLWRWERRKRKKAYSDSIRMMNPRCWLSCSVLVPGSSLWLANIRGLDHHRRNIATLAEFCNSAFVTLASTIDLRGLNLVLLCCLIKWNGYWEWEYAFFFFSSNEGTLLFCF